MARTLRTPPARGPRTQRFTAGCLARRFALLFALALFVSDASWPAYALARDGASVNARHKKKRHQTGMASFYGREFQNRRTANGERFDQNDLTAAHRTLPFDTRVRVTNLENGRRVVVRINDRGPYARGRVLDLSRGAARKLGFVHEGVTLVRIEVLKDKRGERARMADEIGPSGRSTARTPKASSPARPRPAATRKGSPGRA